ncbi:hypothetical protein [Poritiphilus flavus]|uniref:Lipoprotein n=1 Tax=Poritiphilus flavus TaxID=2697053 RepID=A0A6L9EC79_9FLAO|nr:hypothetical protein [Poritiphilus flavus]NAS12354.1 hypothetical protein [Poritiphilus flavus]
MNKLVFVILILILGCKSQKEGVNTNEAQTAVENNLTYVLSDSYGGTEVPELMIIREAGKLKRFFLEINKTRKPGLPIPKVDFSREMVVIYCGGEVSGSRIPALQTKSENPEKLVLSVATEKTENQESSTAITYPFILYTLPLTDREIELEREN